MIYELERIWWVLLFYFINPCPLGTVIIFYLYIYVHIYTFVKVFDEEKNGLLQKSTKLPKYFKLYQTLIAL